MNSPIPTNFYASEMSRVYAEIGISDSQYARLRAAKAFMERHFGDPIALDQLASEACMSRFHFVRKFKAVYGQTPLHFLRGIRVARAKELLGEGRPVGQVGQDVGYDSLPSFSLAFKRGTGHSPKAFQALQFRNME